MVSLYFWGLLAFLLYCKVSASFCNASTLDF